MNNSNYRVYILDDEPLAIKVIERFLSQFPQFNICGQSSDPLLAQAEILQLKPDLLFLDMEMPDLNGLELLDILSVKPSVIITTAYREYAADSFDYSVLDYLVKPIPLKRFTKSIQKFLSLKTEQTKKDKTVDKSFIFVRADRQFIKIKFDELRFVHGLKDYVKIKMNNGQVLTKLSIGNFEKQLPANQFIRIHKSYLVNISKIEKFTARSICIGNDELPIGESYKQQVQTRLSE